MSYLEPVHLGFWRWQWEWRWNEIWRSPCAPGWDCEILVSTQNWSAASPLQSSAPTWHTNTCRPVTVTCTRSSKYNEKAGQTNKTNADECTLMQNTCINRPKNGRKRLKHQIFKCSKTTVDFRGQSILFKFLTWHGQKMHQQQNICKASSLPFWKWLIWSIC